MNIWIIYGIVAVILIFCVVRGNRAGFLRTAFSMLTIVISIVMLSVINPYVREGIEVVGIPQAIYNTISNRMLDKVPDLLGSDSEGRLTRQDADQWTRENEVSGEQQKEWMNIVHIPQWAQEAVYNGEMEIAELVVDSVSHYISNFIANILSYVLSFIVIYILLKIISSFLGIVNHIPIIGGINRTLGGWLGLAQGLVVIWILCLIVTLFSSTEWGGTLIATIESSTPLALLYHGMLKILG